jgi:hypothetical protein
MTAPLPDDELLAMLEARADRVSPDAERSALAGFHAVTRSAADGHGGFLVLPQALSSRGARLPWSVAAVGMVAVVALAVLGGRLATSDEAGTRVPASLPTQAAAGSLAPSAVGGPMVLEPSQLEAALASGGPTDEDVLAADQLRAAISDGSLLGRIVVFDGELELMQVSCPKPGACAVPTLRDLGGVPITIDGSMVLSDPLPSGSLAFRVGWDGLIFLGTALDALAGTTTVRELEASDPSASPGSVRLVPGVLGTKLCLGCPAGTALPGGEFWLLSSRGGVSEDAPVSVPVTLVPGNGVQSGAVGPFVVRAATGAPCTAARPGVTSCALTAVGWQVVAALGDEPIVHIAAVGVSIRP